MYAHPSKNRSWSSSQPRWQLSTLAAAKVAAGLGHNYSLRTMGISHEDGTHKSIPSFSALRSGGTLENQHGKCCQRNFKGWESRLVFNLYLYIARSVSLIRVKRFSEESFSLTFAIRGIAIVVGIINLLHLRSQGCDAPWRCDWRRTSCFDFNPAMHLGYHVNGLGCWGMYDVAAGSSYLVSSSRIRARNLPVLAIRDSINFLRASLDWEVNVE